MRPGLLVILTLVTTLVFGQGHRRMFPGDVLVKVSPLNLLHPVMSSIDGGVSWFVSDRYALQLKAGKKVGLLNFHEGFKHDGFKLLLEGQYYFRHPFYVAVEVGVQKNRFADVMNYYPAPDATESIRDEYSVRVERMTFVNKIGVMLSVSERLSVDFCAGPGFQLQRRDILDLEFDEDKGHHDTHEYYEWVRPPFAIRDSGGFWLTIGFNINWKIVSARPF